MRTRARVLAVGDSGVGKSSLVKYVCTGAVLDAPEWTVGCSVEVRMMADGQPGPLAATAAAAAAAGTVQAAAAAAGGGDAGAGLGLEGLGAGGGSAGEPYFVEVLDVGCHATHELSRSMYYQNVDGILLVYDVANVKSFANLRKWVTELRRKVEPRAAGQGVSHARSRSTYQRTGAAGSSGSATPGSGGAGFAGAAGTAAAAAKHDKRICSLPVLVVGNKCDLVRSGEASKLPNAFASLGFDAVHVSSTNPGLFAADFNQIDLFLRRVADSAATDEVAYSQPGGSGDPFAGAMAMP